MTATECLQQIIASNLVNNKLDHQKLFNGYIIEIEWHIDGIPLCVPGEIVGEWRLKRARRRQNGIWQVQYSYYRPQATYCVELHLEDKQVEIPGTRSHTEHVAMAIAHTLNATILGTGKGKAPFQIHQLENSNE
jgi:hypothetical protein